MNESRITVIFLFVFLQSSQQTDADVAKALVKIISNEEQEYQVSSI